MTYNKAIAERKWKYHKKSEENKLRHLNVSENIIDELRTFDWDIFKSDRRYHERNSEEIASEITVSTDESQADMPTVEEFLNSISEPSMYKFLKGINEITMQVVIMRINGFKAKEIAPKLNLTPKAVYRRSDRFKIKLKKFFKIEGNF